MDRKYSLIADNAALEAAGRLRPNFTEERIIALSNKGTYKRALKDLEETSEIVFTASGNGLNVKLSDSEVFLSEDTQKCSCPAKIFCRHIAAAAIAVYENAPEDAAPAASEIPSEPPSEVSDESEEVLRPDLKYLSEVKAQVGKMLLKGIINCGSTDIETLNRLSLNAPSVHRRQGRLCRLLGEKISLMNKKSAAFSPLETTLAAAKLYNLAKASESFPELLSGKSDYSIDANGKFFCAGMYPWTTDSGYGGVTAAVFSEDGRKSYSCSAVIPLIYKETTERENVSAINKLIHKPFLWESGLSVAKLSGRHFLMYGGHCDLSGRLSSSGNTSCVIGEKLSKWDIPDCAFEEPPYSYDYFESGKKELFFFARIEEIILLRDNAASEFSEYGIAASDGNIYTCVLKKNIINNEALDFLKKSCGDLLKGEYILLGKRGRYMHPISVITENGANNIYFSE